MEKKILIVVGIQSFVLLVFCIIGTFFISAKPNTTVQANTLSNHGEMDSYLSSCSNYRSDNLTVFIDAGHGGVDSGTRSTDLKYEEKTINLAIAQKVRELLEQDYNVNVFMTRETDKFIGPEQRLEIMNQVNADRIISIHCNSADNLEATGIEALYSGESQDSKALAKNCLKEIGKATNQVNRGLINGNSIYIVRNAKSPIALIEVGFLSNEKELNFLLKEENQDKIAQGIVNGMMK